MRIIKIIGLMALGSGAMILAAIIGFGKAITTWDY